MLIEKLNRKSVPKPLKYIIKSQNLTKDLVQLLKLIPIKTHLSLWVCVAPILYLYS